MNGIYLNIELEKTAQRDDNLYDKFVKHLEAEHHGKFVERKRRETGASIQG